VLELEGSQVSDSDSDFGFRVSGLGFGFRTSGFGFGFGVSGSSGGSGHAAGPGCQRPQNTLRRGILTSFLEPFFSIFGDSCPGLPQKSWKNDFWMPPRRAFEGASVVMEGRTLAVSGFDFRVSGFGLRASVFGFRGSVLGFRFSGLGFWVEVFGFRISGFGFRVSVLGVGCRAPRGLGLYSFPGRSLARGHLVPGSSGCEFRVIVFSLGLRVITLASEMGLARAISGQEASAEPSFG